MEISLGLIGMLSNLYMQGQLKFWCNNFSPYISADTGDGVVSQGRYLVALLELAMQLYKGRHEELLIKM